MKQKELFRRYSVFTLSLFIIALGISIITHAHLGTSPISSTPYVFSLNTPISMGSGLFILCAIMIFFQMLLLGKNGVKEKKIELLVQIPISFLFGFFTDIAMWLLTSFSPEPYLLRISSLVVGSFVLAIGISLEVVSDVAMMSAEYTTQIVAKRLKKEFGSVKMVFDILLVLLAVGCSLLFCGKVEGVREGTVIAAIITGPFVRLVMPNISFIKRWFNSESKEVVISNTECDRPTIITISREYGSGGHEIGKMLAERLGISFYDKNLIEMVALEGDLSEDFVSKNEQNIKNSLFYKMIMQDYEVPIEKSLSTEDILFMTQTRVINKIAKEGACVIVGRCANYVLSDYPNKIDIFLHADMEYKKARVISQYGISDDEAEAEILRIDKGRKRHYHFYTGKNWGDASNYLLSFNTAKIKNEDICNIIESQFRV